MQEKFYDFISEPPPKNRQYYKMAKMPFVYLWEFILEASKPWLLTVGPCMAFALMVGFMAAGDTPASFVFWKGVVALGLKWTFYTGSVVAVWTVLNKLFR